MATWEMAIFQYLIVLPGRHPCTNMYACNIDSIKSLTDELAGVQRKSKVSSFQMFGYIFRYVESY